MATWVAALIVMALWAIVAAVLAKAGQSVAAAGDAAGPPDRRNREGGHPMGQEPDRIRAEIEQTRAEMTETVDALGYKADVKSRAKENLQDKKDSAKESIVGVKDRIAGGTPDAGEVKEKARRAVERRAGEPARPGHRRRRRRLRRRHADPVHPRGGREARPRRRRRQGQGPRDRPGGARARQAGRPGRGAQTVKDSGQEHAQQVRDSAQESAQDVRADPSPVGQPR